MDFTTLTPEQQEQLIISGTDFMRSVTEIWGPEKGMQLWDDIATTIGQDFKGAVFFTMMTGTHLGDVRLQDADVHKYVEVIKTVRTYTGYGLKEAKDACDAVRGPSKTMQKLPLVDNKKRRDFVKDLRALGCKAE